MKANRRLLLVVNCKDLYASRKLLTTYHVTYVSLLGPSRQIYGKNSLYRYVLNISRTLVKATDTISFKFFENTKLSSDSFMVKSVQDHYYWDIYIRPKTWILPLIDHNMNTCDSIARALWLPYSGWLPVINIHDFPYKAKTIEIWPIKLQ